MKSRLVMQTPKQTQLNIERAGSEEIFNELARFMINNNKGRGSCTRNEAAKFLKCTSNKATRLLKSFVMEGKIRRDSEAEEVFWLVVE